MRSLSFANLLHVRFNTLHSLSNQALLGKVVDFIIFLFLDIF